MAAVVAALVAADTDLKGEGMRLVDMVRPDPETEDTLARASHSISSSSR